MRLGPELMPGAIAIRLGDIADVLPQLAEEIDAHAVLEHHEPLLVELTPFFVRHG
jgi:hypothetical protein